MNNIILVGNPNVGKTTLFNNLTNSNEKASNWHGVTVDSKTKSYKFLNSEYKVTDLPGLYSISGYSNEEKIASNYLIKHNNDLVINICDANNLKRNLNLTFDLLRNSYKVILVVNMINDYFYFDEKLLSRILGIKVIGVDARKSKSINRLKIAINSYFTEKNPQFYQKSTNFQKIVPLLDNFITNLNEKKKQDISNKIDKILLNKFLFFPCFFVILFSVFYLTFGKVGDYFMSIFNSGLNVIFDSFSSFLNSLNISAVLKSFITSAILNSLSTILSFLPQIVLLLILFNIIEDIGLVSRFAFMLDGFLKKIGLTGKSLFSLMMGYGCTASAVLTTRNLESDRLRKRTVLLLPFSTCSAKLPIFLLISSIFFDKYKYLYVFGLYIFSIIIMIVCASIYKKIIPNKLNIFILEMPKYRLPYLKKILKDTINISLEFIIKIGTTIISFSILFWLLQNFSIKFEFLNGENYTNSLLYKFSSILSIIFKPIGLGNAGIVSVLIFGLIAKELIVVGLLFVNGVSNLELLKLSLTSSQSLCYFNNLTAIIFLVFILLYSPCISALSAIKSEFDKKTAWYVFLSQFIISYIICLILFNILNYYSITKFLTLFLLFSIAIVTKIMIQYKRKKMCGGNCYACRKF